MANKKKPTPPEEPKDESVMFLLDTAELTIRDAITKASQTAHAVQMDSLTDALMSLAQAKFYFNKPEDYFARQEEENG